MKIRIMGKYNLFSNIESDFTNNTPQQLSDMAEIANEKLNYICDSDCIT